MELFFYTHCDTVNNQRAVEKRLHAEGADQSLPIAQPANDRTGVSVDGTVE